MSGRTILPSVYICQVWIAIIVVAWCGYSTKVEANNTVAIIQFINNITLTGRTITTNGSTSEDKALKWLVTENDPMYQFVPGSAVNATRLAQRYALATYFIQNAYYLPSDTWSSNQSECTWIYIGCSNSSIVTTLGNGKSTARAIGAIPIDLGLLSSVRSVSWNLRGALPAAIGKWTDLSSVHMECYIDCLSTLPSSIGDWRNVQELSIKEQSFIGSLPATIGNWTNLRQIDIIYTSLTGTLPASIGNWTNVELLSINYNRFSGSLPTTIRQWSSLRQFDTFKRFSGSLPIGSWVNLTRFDVSDNRFTGAISPEVANWTSIQQVELQNNNFIGTIPRSLCSSRNISLLLADCPNEVACWCCTGCARPNITAGTMSGILFRELRQDAQDGSWGSNSSDIPGFDHVALSYLDSVFESHPGYKNGPVYVSADRIENRTIPVVNGVQNVHTIETFKHNSRNATFSPVIQFRVIPIENATAVAMKNLIASRLQIAGFLAFNSVEEFVATHSPAAQKGGNGKFTGVGLVEWAAEQAGINNRQGFVPNELESIISANETFPLLSPELVYSALQNQDLFFSTQYFLKGYFDPVDHVLTDPVGRRTGVINRTQYHQIPNAFYSPKGDVETLVVVNPLPGTYKLTVFGIPGKKGVAALSVPGRPTTTMRTTGGDGAVQDQLVQVPENFSSRGDVNGDGTINQTDLVRLKSIIPRAVVNNTRPADMDGDGQLNQVDVDILELFLNRITRAPTPKPSRSPTRSPIRSPTRSPIRSPTRSPTRAPTRAPTRSPTRSPTRVPTRSPTRSPTRAPTRSPIRVPPTPRAGDAPSLIISPAISNVAPSADRPASVPETPTTAAPASVPIVGRPTLTPVAPTKNDSPRPPVLLTAPRVLPTSRPVDGRPCPAADKCSGGFMLHRTILSRCIQRCISKRRTRRTLRWRAWKCGKC